MTTTDPIDPNPYAAPQTVETIPKAGTKSDIDGRMIAACFSRWLVICLVSAAPSFYFGLVFGTTPDRIAAMLLGILIFVVLYTYVDLNHMRPRANKNPRLKRTFRIGYGTRIAASIVFPLGMMADIWLGMISTSIVGALPFINNSFVVGDRNETSMSFFATLLTTLIQGTLLNIVLAAYMYFVYMIQKWQWPDEI